MSSMKCENDRTFPVATFTISDDFMTNFLRKNLNSSPAKKYGIVCKIQCYNSMVTFAASQLAQQQRCLAIKSVTEIDANEIELAHPDLKTNIIDTACFESFKKALWKWNSTFVERQNEKPEQIDFNGCHVCSEEL